MNTLTIEIQSHLNALLGLRLTIARRAADMLIFHFGQIRTAGNGIVGEYALHIQCPWRIEDSRGIVTGYFDLYQPADTKAPVDWETWDYDKDPNLQDKLIGAWMGDQGSDKSILLHSERDLVVDAVHAESVGGATIEFSGGYRLVVFPAGTNSENWRIFRPDSDDPHFVVDGDRRTNTL